MAVQISYILIAHVPVWSLSIGHDLPHDDAVAPYITGRGELPVLDGLWSGPPDGNLSTLRKNVHLAGLDNLTQADSNRRDQNDTFSFSHSLSIQYFD